MHHALGKELCCKGMEPVICSGSVFEGGPSFNDRRGALLRSRASWTNGDELFEERSWYASPLVLPYSTPHCKGDEMLDRDHFGTHCADQTWYLPTSVFWASQKVLRCRNMIGWLCVLDVDLFAKGFAAVVPVGCRCLSRCV